MGFLRKVTKKIGRGIKKVGKKIGKAFKSIMKPFAKVFNKLGPLGSIAMMMILPGIGTMLSGFGANIAAGTSIFGQVGAVGQAMGTAVKFVGNAINYVASAPKKIFGSITDALGRGFDFLTGAPKTGGPSWFDNFKKDFVNFDVSKVGQDKITQIGNELDFFKTTRAGVGPDAVPGGTETFSTDIPKVDLKPELDINLKPTTPTFDAATGEITGGTMVDAGEVITETTGDYSPASGTVAEGTGVIGRGRAALNRQVKNISGTKIPGVGTVGDTAWAANAGLTAFNAYSSVAGTDLGEIGTAGDFGYQASDLLGPTTDQGGIYNMTAPTWSYDYNQSYTNNMTNAQNVWNNHYGFVQSFDPSATPGYGFGYEQWLYNSMGIGR